MLILLYELFIMLFRPWSTAVHINLSIVLLYCRKAPELSAIPLDLHVEVLQVIRSFEIPALARF